MATCQGRAAELSKLVPDVTHLPFMDLQLPPAGDNRNVLNSSLYNLLFTQILYEVTRELD